MLQSVPAATGCVLRTADWGRVAVVATTITDRARLDGRRAKTVQRAEHRDQMRGTAAVTIAISVAHRVVRDSSRTVSYVLFIYIFILFPFSNLGRQTTYKYYYHSLR